MHGLAGVDVARDTGLRNLPLHDTAQNRIWLEIISLAPDLLAWMPMLALTSTTRRWEPKKLRLPARWPRTGVIIHAIDRLHALPNPG